MSTLNPLFARCPSPACTNWEVPVDTEAQKAAVEKRHRSRLHPHSVDSVPALVADDPRHETERREIEQAILVAARRNSGKVSANDVRPLLPAYVTPQLVGAIFQAMRKTGVLVLLPGEDERNTDARGRNTNKSLPRYCLKEYAAALGEAS